MVTKSMLYKRKYPKGTPILDNDIEKIGGILFMLEFIPRHLDYEEATHDVTFRNINEETRKDITYHYADKVPDNVNGKIKGYKYLDRITKVDIVSFFTLEKEGFIEFRIYQIGRRYGSDEFTVADLFGLGELNYDVENFDKAIKYYNRALEIDPDDPGIIHNLGLAYVCKESYQKGISLYRKSLDIDPEDAVTWNNLGIAYELNNELEKARDAYQKASDFDPSDDEVRHHLSEIKKQLEKA